MTTTMHAEPHKYEYDVDLLRESAAAHVVQLVGAGKRVLEVGAGPGSIARQLKDHGGCRVTAIERDQTAIAKLTAFCDQVYPIDLNAENWTEQMPAHSTFDVIVAADVLEHLLDPWRTLRMMPALLVDDGYLVISLPHVGHSTVIAAMLGATFDYQDAGLLDRTHLRFFCIRDMQALFEQAALKIVDARFVVRSPDQTELAVHWHKLPASLRNELARTRYGKVYQVVIKAVRNRQPVPGLQLASLPVPARSGLMPGTPLARRFGFAARNLLRPMLPPAAREKIGGWLHRRGIRL